MTHGIFSGRSALGTDDAGPTTQTLICPKGQAFVEGKCVDNIERPPTFPVKADTVSTKVPAVDTSDIIVNPIKAPPVAATTGTSIPWGWIALGVLALGGAWWVIGKGQPKRVRRNGLRKHGGKAHTKRFAKRSNPWSGKPTRSHVTVVFGKRMVDEEHFHKKLDECEAKMDRALRAARKAKKR